MPARPSRKPPPVARKGSQWIAASLTAVASACILESAVASDEPPDPSKPFRIPEATDVLFDRYCYSCHDKDTQKGDIRLDNLADLDTPTRLNLLNRMQELLHFEHMSPTTNRQPTAEERKAILELVSNELAVHNASTLEAELLKPEFGNYVDHEMLFSGEFKDLPGFTHDRRWLISEYIINAKFQRLLEHTPPWQTKPHFPALQSSPPTSPKLRRPRRLRQAGRSDPIALSGASRSKQIAPN